MLFREKTCTYDDDVTIAPRDLISSSEEGADGIEELTDLCFHSNLMFIEFSFKKLLLSISFQILPIGKGEINSGQRIRLKIRESILNGQIIHP